MSHHEILSKIPGIFYKGGLYNRTYLTKGARNILIELINYTLEHTCDLDNDEFELVISSMTFLKNKLNIDDHLPTVVLSKEIAKALHYWNVKNIKSDPFESEDHKRASQWVTNLWNKKINLYL